MTETATSPAEGKRPTIIIADDDANSASFLVWAIRKIGFQALWVTDGQVAFQKAQELKPAAILMDMMMPGFDGMMGIRLLRMNEDTKHIPIVVVSGLTGRKEQEICKQEGANEFLTKPFTIDKLRQVLAKYTPGVTASPPKPT